MTLSRSLIKPGRASKIIDQISQTSTAESITDAYVMADAAAVH